MNNTIELLGRAKDTETGIILFILAPWRLGVSA